MIAIEQTDNLVNVAVLGEFTLADFKTFEEQSLYKLQSPGTANLLFDLRAISVGLIMTRCDELQGIFDDLGRGKSYGMSTTHMSKLLPRIEGGGGAGCPIIVIGITKQIYEEDE